MSTHLIPGQKLDPDPAHLPRRGNALPLLVGLEALVSPSSRPSGEASVPPPPAGKIPAVLHEEMVRGVNSQLLECWAGRVPR